jgi:anti-anti-sigma factor
MSGAEALSVRMSMHGRTAVVTFAGELDLNTIADAHAALAEVSEEAPRLVLDLSDVNFADSIGLGLLMQLQRAEGERLRLVRGPDTLHRTVTISGLDKILPWCDDLQHALFDES